MKLRRAPQVLHIYNGAGSLVADKSRGIAYITYDANNTPGAIYFTNGSVTKYVYGATGEKLRVIYQTAVPNITVPIGSVRELSPSEILSTDSTDYLLGVSLTLRNLFVKPNEQSDACIGSALARKGRMKSNGRIDKYQFDEGYCRATTYSGNTSQDTFSFYYYDRDHLGNIRQVTKADRITNGTVVQSMNYYPFGAQFCDGSTDSNVQPYKYNFSIEREKRKLACSSEREKKRLKVNGKELDRMHGLDTYDYGARQYNPVTARWDRMDPLSEKYYGVSPYVYCGNNPINAIDDKGDSTCVLNYGSGSNQHLAMLIQNDEGKWSYFSFNGIKIFNSTSGKSGGAPHNNLGERSFDSPTVFLNSIYNSDGSYEEIEHDRINGYGYTEGYILPTTPKEDKKIKYNFMKAVNEGYNLLKNQCTNSVQKALNSVGVKTTTINKFNYSTTSGAVYPMPPHYTVGVNPYLPSLAFKAIRDNNPNGIYIKR